MAVLEFRASVKDVRLPSNQSGKFVVAFCSSLLINIFSASYIHFTIINKLGNFVTSSSYVAALICFKFIRSSGKPFKLNSIMKDEVEFLEALDATQNETTKV